MSSAPSQTYARQLLPKLYGYPLFVPEPNDNLPRQYRDRGVSIGDVGIIMPNGSFSFAFNTTIPADDPINCHGVPEGFEQLHLFPAQVSLHGNMHKRGSDIFSSSVKKRNIAFEGTVKENENVPAGLRAAYSFTSASTEAAILTMPEGAASQDYDNLATLRHHAIRNAEAWYKFVNGTLGREAANGSLYLVTGCDKSTTWAAASVSQISETNSFSLQFTALFTEASAAYTYSWETCCPATVRTGPEVCESLELPQNQCLFLRGFKMMLRGPVASQLKGPSKVTSITDSKPNSLLPAGKGGSVPFGGGGKSGKGSGNGSLGGSQSPTHYSYECLDTEEISSDEEMDWESDDRGSTVYHPLNAINKYLLAMTPNAKVAVTHDSDWWPLSYDQDELPSDDDLLDRLRSQYRLSTESGGVFLVPTNLTPLKPYDQSRISIHESNRIVTIADTTKPLSPQTPQPGTHYIESASADEKMKNGAAPFALPLQNEKTSSFHKETKKPAYNNQSILCRLPPEILENIALELVSICPLGTPSCIVPLLLTCKRLNNVLAFDSCHNLYARIFKTKFDLGAVRRRLGPKAIRSTNLALQLRKYCSTLQDIRRGDIYSPHIHDILRTAFFIACESDGKNAYQLAWAGLDVFIDRFVRQRLREDASQHNGWLAESSNNALALWLMWFMTTRERLAAESEQQRQQIIGLLLPYIILPFRYPSAHAPPNHFELPLRTGSGDPYPRKVFTAHEPYPSYREPHHILEDVDHFGRSLEFSQPLVTIPAKLLYFSRREMVPMGIPTHLPINRAHALALGRTQVGPTQADVHEVNAHQSVKLVPRPSWDYWEIMSEEDHSVVDEGLWTPTPTSASGQWDNDWNRVALCSDPWRKIPMKGMTYTHGILDGLWQGRFLVRAQAELLDLTPPNFSEYNPWVTTVPLFMRLREHHCINPCSPVATGGQHNGFDDGLSNTWLSVTCITEADGKVVVTDENSKQFVYETFVKGKSNSHNDETCAACIRDREGKDDSMRKQSAALAEIPPVDSEIEDIFVSCGLGADDNMGEDMDSENEVDAYGSDREGAHEHSCSGIRDLLLTGETDLSHGQAWNHYIFYGRVRRWDGLIALVRVPRHMNGHEHGHLGRWVFTGYVVGGENFVGTWRAVGAADVGIPTWESAFTVSRRE